ncbi:MAG: Uma2 family endonuclease [Tepidiformaceae bacterium]
MTTPTRVTVEEFLALEETKPYLELISGEVVPKTMPGPRHSAIVFELVRQLGNFLRVNPIARGNTELRHIQRDEERIFLPDISVTLRERWQGGVTGPVEVMPDLAIEVLSPDDRPGRIAERVNFYIRAGVSLIWIIDPDLKNITIYRPGTEPAFLQSRGTVDALPVLPGFELDLAELFTASQDA